MSQRERDVLKVMAEVEAGSRSQREAGRLLGRTIRQLRRIQRRLEAEGDAGVIHRLPGRPSHARIDPLLRKCRDNLIAKADALCRQPPMVYKLTGPRLLSVSRDCLRRVYTLGLAWRLTGKAEYADKVLENLLAACAFKDWNPPHFLDTAEMAHAVGVGYDWLFSRLKSRSAR